MNKFEQKEMKKKRPIKNTWHDWLISYILKPIRQFAVGFKVKFVSPFKTNTPGEPCTEVETDQAN